MNLNATEKSLESLVEILNRAKEIAIAQSSDLYDQDIRKSVANDVLQMRNQVMAIANKRIGNRYLFGGFKSLTQPFTEDGQYKGDTGQVNLEVSKDFFVPINLNGKEVFISSQKYQAPTKDPIREMIENQETNPQATPELENQQEHSPAKSAQDRGLASLEKSRNFETQKDQNSIFSQLESLSVGLETNDSALIRSLLEKFDDSVSRLITLRTKIGSITNSIETTRNTIESENIDAAERRSYLVDADIAELFSDITRQKSILETTYQSTQGMLNQNLMDFLR